MFATTTHGHRHLRRVALLAGLPLVMVGVTTAPAQAAVECGGFTQVDAAALGYTTLMGGPGPDTLIGPAGTATWVFAGDGPDIIQTGSDQDLVCGKLGNDIITTGEGFDQVWGGDGKDVLDVGAGPDHAEGGQGDDVIFGGPDNDVLYGDNPPNVLVPPTTGADTLSGGEGDDELRGGPSADHLMGNSGTDRLFGDEDDDLLDGGTSPGDADEGDGGAGSSDLCVQIDVLPPLNCP